MEPESQQKNSNNLQISPERQSAFIEFVRSLPRTCSPSIFNPSTSNCDEQDPFDIKQHSLLENSGSQSFGNWSFEEYAMIYGQDFSNVDELEGFHSLIHTTVLSKELDNENERYFSQEKILPSPKLTDNTSLESGFKSCREEAVSRSTGSFIRLLDSTNFSCNYPQEIPDEYVSEQKVYHDVSMLSIESINQQKNKTDSDFISMNENDANSEPMEISNSRNLSLIQSLTPKLNSNCNFSRFGGDFSNGFHPSKFPLDNFIKDISPIVAQPSKSIRNQNNHVQMETNKENYVHFQPFIDSSPIPLIPGQNGHILNSGTVMKNKIVFGSTSILQSPKNLDNLKLSPNQKSRKIILGERNEYSEFKTPYSSQSRCRSRLTRAKLLFNEFASTPNEEVPSNISFTSNIEANNLQNRLYFD